MIKSLRETGSKGNIPHRHDPETGPPESSGPLQGPGPQQGSGPPYSSGPQQGSGPQQDPGPRQDPASHGALLTPRSAGIFGASVVIAACAGVLTYLAMGRLATSTTGLPTALLAAGAAFAGAIRLLDTIIA
jgi:serine/threonine kinase PknH